MEERLPRRTNNPKGRQVLRKGIDKQKSEEEAVLSICYQIISNAYLNKPCPKFLQYCSEGGIEDFIYENKRSYINLTNSEVEQRIFSNGDLMKERIEKDILDYYII